MQTTFTIEEIKKYIISQDSLGDVLYNLNEKKIIEANTSKEDDNEEKGRGCCSECGEGYDNEEDWKYNTECECCGHPIPENLIIKKG
jgi:PHP family Zn ribbon phosphoesterase